MRTLKRTSLLIGGMALGLGTVAHADMITVPAGLDEDGEAVWDDDQAQTSDAVAAMAALTVVGRNMRAAEMGHERHEPGLDEAPMESVGKRWLALLDSVQAGYMDEDRLMSGHADGAATDSDASMATLADGMYIYHMHHSGGRFAAHDLEDDLVFQPAAMLSMLTAQMLDAYHEDGHFGLNDDDDVDGTELAYGLDAWHGAAYAWIRHGKSDGEGDMGLVDEDQLEAWMHHTPDDLVDMAHAFADTLDAAWDDDAGVYDFGSGTTWQLDELGSLIRGHKALYEVLYFFDGDADRAEELFHRTADMVEAIVGDGGLVQDWGLPEAVSFEDGSASADGDVDVAAQWRFIHHLTGGFAFTRESSDLSSFLSDDREGLTDSIGEAVDRMVLGALHYQMPMGELARTVDHGDGAIIDDTLRTRTVTAFLVGSGNAYSSGKQLAPPDAWEDDDDVAQATAAFYAGFLNQAQLLQDELIGSDW